MTWYDLEIKILDKNTTGAEKMNCYKNEYNRSDINAGFDLYSSSNVKVTKQTPEFISFGIMVRLVKVEPTQGSNDCLKSYSHFWLMPRSSIYKSGLIMGNSTGVIDKSYRGELKAPVWAMIDNVSVSRNDRLFQIVAPDMGWIRNVNIVESMPQTQRGSNGFGSSGI